MGGLAVYLSVQVEGLKREVPVCSWTRLASRVFTVMSTHPYSLYALTPPRRRPNSSLLHPVEGITYTFMAVCTWHFSGAPDVGRAQVIVQTERVFFQVVLNSCHEFCHPCARHAYSTSQSTPTLTDDASLWILFEAWGYSKE